MSGFFRRRLQLQLLLILLAAVSVAALSGLLIWDSIQNAEKAVLADMSKQLNAALTELASVECDAGKVIESRESRPDQRIKVADGLTPAEMTFIIPGPRCPLWVSH